jgi:hypothetical protein
VRCHLTYLPVVFLCCLGLISAWGWGRQAQAWDAAELGAPLFCDEAATTAGCKIDLTAECMALEATVNKWSRADRSVAPDAKSERPVEGAVVFTAFGFQTTNPVSAGGSTGAAACSASGPNAGNHAICSVRSETESYCSSGANGAHGKIQTCIMGGGERTVRGALERLGWCAPVARSSGTDRCDLLYLAREGPEGQEPAGGPAPPGADGRIEIGNAPRGCYIVRAAGVGPSANSGSLPHVANQDKRPVNRTETVATGPRMEPSRSTYGR